MAMYAVVKTGGKQFIVHEGMELTVDLMKVKKSDQVKFDCLLKFDDEGKDLFGEITKRNVGKVVAIYLDGTPISQPVVQDEITSGEAKAIVP